MRVKAAALAVLLGLGSIVAAPPAQAYQNGFSFYNDATSLAGLIMVQSYNNEWVGVPPGHWNFEYGNQYNAQSVNYLYVEPWHCITTYRVNPAYNGWIITSRFDAYDTGVWVDVSAKSRIGTFVVGWNRVIVRSTSLGRFGAKYSDCSSIVS